MYLTIKGMSSEGVWNMFWDEILQLDVKSTKIINL